MDSGDWNPNDRGGDITLQQLGDLANREQDSPIPADPENDTENILTVILPDGSSRLSTDDFSRADLIGNDFNQKPRARTHTSTLPVEGETSPWGSLWIANGVSFLGAVQFSVFFSSLYPYLEEIDKTATQSYFGWVIAGYSIGQMIASPIFGYWSNRMRQTRIPVAAGVVILIIGNLLYCFVEAFDSHRKEILLVARTIVGIGAGNLSALRAYVATASTIHDRAKAITLSTAAFTLGFMIGPGLQAAFVPLKYPGYVSGAFHFDMYTAPGYVANIANIAVLVLLFTSFHEKYSGIVPTKTKKDPFFVLPVFDRRIAALMIFGWFAFLFCGVNIETIVSPYSIAMFNWTNKEAVLYNGLILFTSAAISFFVYMAYIMFLGRKIDDRKSIVVAMVILTCFWVVTFPWPGYSNKLDFKISKLVNATYSNGTYPHLPLPNSTAIPYTGATEAPSGCKPTYEWCRTTPAIPLWLYLLFWPLLSVSFPMGNVAIATLYSKVLGPRRQGTMQGFMTASGSASRIIGPIAMSYLFENFGPRVCWALCALVVLVTSLPWIFLYRTALPLNPKPEMKPGQSFQYNRGHVYRF